ncbi:D-alanyl-D-alanine carboxypeptidase/D-alanyl-D-alanine endopeptidase [Marinitenerispora sediminis]|uniref:D-alanyl-D-alanine carboxypeptidase/D-alanyl-D-alanine-endopeptidase n=1 Tax=Marinitenerispora sediminis TaxID=1931232 RepID=A0A368T9J9_9ACTN|nr:D-alanyl-D-alanine carboxypeptidase/D-alanyl-D-alanine-endopeptidase [Marinitenerispora sediminis]RCV55164.1 D-alanyl-D-alanine carboxypeptidase/D-alanyl-D-alanine-endopeptidase [Marinitenerispora sediminis]RCV61250.1 D-alanyl-D-alanine carboxypeptidase/D-alanyl-D-alanine-endopeptidase [Marinitenerispora sediminis]RCV61521.1 D-alanyl-D-alanine carboxypeptidase/D-alanyl-D-alanine-endopeptidase [Marinitenerispora sediminis]
MRHDRVWALLTLASLNIFVLVAGVVAWDVIASRPPETVAHPVALAQEAPAPAGTTAKPVNPDLLADKLDDRMSNSGIDDGLSAFVVDAETGDPLFARDEGETAVPASTTKVVTAVAALQAVGPDARIPTDVVQGAEPGQVILVGGGDPTLTEVVRSGEYPRLATLEELAESTAGELLAAGIGSVRLGYDDSRYSGPDMAPGWKPGYVDEGSVATVHALMLDGGRVYREENYSERVGDPPRAAAEAFARQLEAAGITVEGAPAPATAAADAAPIATVESAPVSALVEKMMLESDNNIAEALAHQVARAEGGEMSFAGGAAAVMSVISDLGVPDVHVEDGSGLSVNNRITPKALVDLLLLAADDANPDLHYVVSGLPTAHFTGTLTDRYTAYEASAAGAGLIRAKTGTLNGVSTLAGTAYDADGRLLVFAFMANNPAAEGRILDTFASALVECGCS